MRSPNRKPLVICPIAMSPEEIAQIRRIPKNKRSAIVRNLLREAGYLDPLPEQQSA